MAFLRLPQRRLIQVSIFDLLLGTTGVIALLVSYQSLAPRAIVYTAGYIGGLVGTAIAMSRREARIWQVLCLGGFVGVCVGWLATIAIGALPLRLPLPLEWLYYWRVNPIERKTLVQISTALSLAGALVATILYVTVTVLKDHAYQSTGSLQEINGDLDTPQS